MGTYSEDIPLKLAKKMSAIKKHSVFSTEGQRFWTAYGSDTLHYGKHYLEGELPLSQFGKKTIKKIFSQKRIERNRTGMISVKFLNKESGSWN